MVTCKNADVPFAVHRGMGLVSQIFNEPIMLTLKGNLGIGHTRYSTMGGCDNVQLAQPFVVHTSYGSIAVAHNGELVNSAPLRQKILENGKNRRRFRREFAFVLIRPSECPREEGATFTFFRKRIFENLNQEYINYDI